MTHPADPDLLNNVLQPLTDQGPAGFAEGIRLLVDEAMHVERHQVLQAQPYERTDTRQGDANGYKPQTLTSRIGPITFRVPQARDQTAFHPTGRRAWPACGRQWPHVWDEGKSNGRRSSESARKGMGRPSGNIRRPQIRRTWRGNWRFLAAFPTKPAQTGLTLGTEQTYPSRIQLSPLWLTGEAG